MSTVPFSFFVGFPPPVLEVEDAYPLAGTDVNVTCSGHVLTSPSPTLRLQGAPNLSAPGEPAWFLFTAREEDDGRNLSCEASLEVQGQRLFKTTEMQLHVFCEWRPDGPRRGSTLSLPSWLVAWLAEGQHFSN